MTAFAIGLLLTASTAFSAVQPSALWGERGEQWNPQSRLPDFSFAGYRCGEKSLPNVPPGMSVKDLGAKGDGVTDDSQAFLDALEKVRSGAIEVPPGRYRITRLLEINRPNVVLRGEGMRVTLNRPLRTDVRSEWKPQLRAFTPTVTESGVENLGFEFPLTPYAGHFTELGFNPVAFIGVAHCWVRNIRVINADSGPYVSGVFNTVDSLVLGSARPVDKQQCRGHHGLSLGGSDNLATRFDL